MPSPDGAASSRGAGLQRPGPRREALGGAGPHVEQSRARSAPCVCRSSRSAGPGPRCWGRPGAGGALRHVPSRHVPPRCGAPGGAPVRVGRAAGVRLCDS